MRVAKICFKTCFIFVLTILFMQAVPLSAFAQKGAENTTQAVHTFTITYQGRLTDANGNAVVDGDHTLTFKLYDQATDGSALWQETQNLATSNGVFTAQLGSVSSMDALLFDKVYYLGVTVDGGSELAPRTALSTVPYAQRAHSVDDSVLTVSKLDGAGASKGQVLKWDGSQWVPAADEVGSVSGSIWNLSGNSGTSPGDDFLGTTDDKDLVFKVNNTASLRIMPDDTTASIIMGDSSNTIGPDLSGSVIGGGGYNAAPNQITGSFSVISGGISNTVSGPFSIVGGGKNNLADKYYSTVGGGNANHAEGFYSIVSGGSENVAKANTSSVLGGARNEASGILSVVLGGTLNIASGGSSFEGGGEQNVASGRYSTVVGGFGNVASGSHSTIGGGENNKANGDHSLVAGGDYNKAPGLNSAVAGGSSNIAQGRNSFVTGNHNTARGSYSFAAGRYSRANHDGSFVWNSYATSDSASSSAPNQFIVMADGGVGFGTTTPDAPFQIASHNNHDLINTEGDFKIGDTDYRLKIGVATSGIPGFTTIMADGGVGQLIFGSNKTYVAVIDKKNGLYPHSDNTYSLGTSSNRWSTVYAANGTVQTSDRRLKTGIQPLQYGLKDILKLKPVSYRWKKSSGLHRDDGQEHLGLIAQEVQQVIHEVVDAPKGKQKYYGMNYTALVPVLIKAVQQQEQQIEQLQEIHESNQSRLDMLESRVKALMTALENRDNAANATETKTAN